MNSSSSITISKKALYLIVTAAIVATSWGLLFDVEINVKPSSLISGSQQPQVDTQATKIPETGSTDKLSYSRLAAQVIPKQGLTIKANWGDMGTKLINSGAIDLDKFEKRYNGLSSEQKKVLLEENLSQITFTEGNIQFWTNMLWSLGLTQRSKVLSEGPMQKNIERTPIERYASTAGWTLGSKGAMDLFNSTDLVSLTPEQDKRVYSVAENIFRPCCGNHTAYPDCNHGMAVLGLLELMASQGANDEEMYAAALSFNSYAFPSTYITLAAFFENQGTTWNEVDPAESLGSTYSSGLGAKNTAQAVGEISGTPKQGGSCGV